MALVAILLSIAVLTEYGLSFLKVFGFLTFNLSLFLGFICYYFLGYRYFLLFLATKFLTIALITPGDIRVHSVGVAIASLAQFFFVSFYFIFRKSFWFIIPRARTIKWEFIEIQISFVLSLVLSSILLALLNTFLFNLIYFYLYGIIDSISLSEAKKKMPFSFLGIENYFRSWITLYFIFNLCNYAISIVATNIILAIELKTQFLSKHFVAYNQHKY
ncbi:MPN527 family putative ECF transporter permease subunit [Mycoplasmopsis gallopavonis]|uniref:MPN527 family putative ECF transporter permease subunit n=1 Tax=Mycoplasmopsis gallopavonis TaxID=76629 RepID=UPI0038CD91DE